MSSCIKQYSTTALCWGYDLFCFEYNTLVENKIIVNNTLIYLTILLKYFCTMFDSHLPTQSCIQQSILSSINTFRQVILLLMTLVAEAIISCIPTSSRLRHTKRIDFLIWQMGFTYGMFSMPPFEPYFTSRFEDGL